MKVDDDLKPCARVVVLQLPVVWCEGIKVDMSRYCVVVLVPVWFSIQGGKGFLR